MSTIHIYALFRSWYSSVAWSSEGEAYNDLHGCGANKGNISVVTRCASGRDRWSNLKDNRAMIRRAVYLTSNLAHPDAVHDPITENDYDVDP